MEASKTKPEKIHWKRCQRDGVIKSLQTVGFPHNTPSPFPSSVRISFLNVFELFLVHLLDFGGVFDWNDDFTLLFVLPLFLPLFLFSLLQNLHFLLLFRLQIVCVLLGQFLLQSLSHFRVPVFLASLILLHGGASLRLSYFPKSPRFRSPA